MGSDGIWVVHPFGTSVFSTGRTDCGRLSNQFLVLKWHRSGTTLKQTRRNRRSISIYIHLYPIFINGMAYLILLDPVPCGKKKKRRANVATGATKAQRKRSSKGGPIRIIHSTPSKPSESVKIHKDLHQISPLNPGHVHANTSDGNVVAFDPLLDLI